MLQGGTLLDTAYMIFRAIVAIVLWGAAAIGYLRAPINWAERVFAFVAAGFLVYAVPWTDPVGFALPALFVVWHVVRSRRTGVVPAA